MAEPSVSDPAAMWREFMQRWERETNASLNKLMGTDDFSKSMNQASGLSLRLQQQMTEGMGRYLAALNLPNRQEVTAIGERLGAIEARLDQIATSLARLTNLNGHEPAKPKLARTRRPPAPGGTA